MFKNIVIGMDGSEPSKTALRLACDLAGKYRSKLHLVHTPQPELAAYAFGAAAGYHAAITLPSPEDVKAAADAVVSDAAAIAKEYGQTFKTVKTDRGHPVDEIIACADACGADLIVTGRRGLGSISALVQGSTSQGISHYAKCAVLSVI